jgi:hypothetical protein
MQKSKPQSKQAPFCITFFAWNFLSFPTPFEPFWNNSFDKNQHGPEVKIHLDAKIKQDLNKNQGKKRKLNAVLEKENTRWTIRVKNGVFLANEKQVHILQKKFVGVQPFISANKTKENWKLK